MKANETKVEDFLSSNKTQFVIPVYQRNYDWSEEQCKQLLNDIFEVGTNEEMNAHFIGSVVYVHDDVYQASKIKELTVIDGQQRLTTLTVIYLVIYSLAKELDDEDLENEISETYLINKFASEEGKLKLRPTENNDKALKYLLRGDLKEEFLDYSKLIDNFNYFKGRITKENYQVVREGLAKLMFVEISLDREKDDPQRIFESLNSTGLELSQADLIRNYILIGLKREDQNKIYENYWEFIEKSAKDETLNENRVSEYIRDYLTLENKNIPKKGQVYLAFKAKYPTASIAKLESNLAGIKRLVSHYNKLINPENASDKEIRLHLNYISRLEINVAIPFLMKVYDDFVSEIIDKDTFLKVLELVQSFSWRRFIVGLPTNVLNKIFMSLYDKVNHDDYLLSIQKSLLQRSGIQRFPKDEEVKYALKTKDIYSMKSKSKVYFLERLENFKNRERVLIEKNPDITIEHIFPQKPDPQWEYDLGNDEYNFIKDNYLNVIGNLTLSGNNRELGNKSFTDKRDLEGAGYKDSRLWLNKHLKTLDRWGKKEIEERVTMIYDRFLEIWEYPQIEVETGSDSEEIDIFESDDPKGKSLEYAIFRGEKIEVDKVTNLYKEVFKQLFELQPEAFFSSDLGERINLTKDRSKLRQPVQINDTYFIEANIDSIGKFERIKQALTTFSLETELSIKYAENE